MMKSQISHATVRSGIRMQKRKMCHGSSNGVLAGGEIGKKGAMPEPTTVSIVPRHPDRSITFVPILAVFLHVPDVDQALAVPKVLLALQLDLIIT